VVSYYGRNIQISLFGQSHAKAVGVTINGLPAGFALDMDELNAFLQRRAPGKSALSTKRREADEFEIIGGAVDGVLCGAPFAAIIPNTNTRSDDYASLQDVPRPGHADYTAQIKYKGAQDPAGGGHFSGRMTAPLCIAGGICLQLLRQEGIEIGSHIERIASVVDQRFDPVKVTASDFTALSQNEWPTLDQEVSKKMIAAITAAADDDDSLGGVIECAVVGLPPGLGDPIFAGMENRIAGIVFGIPAVKGIEFGNGFDAAGLSGFENNDAYQIIDGKISTKTNNHGGVLGGITTGMPLIFRTAIKPTPSIFKQQDSISLSSKENTKLSIKGRHDPCIVPRAVPCIEAAAAIAVYDALLEEKKYL